MPVEIKPAALARLVDFAERPRVEDWSLRAALVRYAQPEAQRASNVLEVLRRVDHALATHASAVGATGPQLWDALSDGSGDADAFLVGVLRAAQQLDHLGETLATWAVEYGSARPNNEVDRVVAEVTHQLDALGVPREERPPGPRNRG
ncbi:MAG TPA: hypothetical protein VFR41_13950 [Acidimicrobiia bacterium]|nr:hypothetical protein [Acidimicrobiia bacterium]